MAGVASVIHTCHAYLCDVEVPPRLLMCRRHWFMVAKKLRTQVWLHYRPGQEIDKEPSVEWVAAANVAIAAVAYREGHDEYAKGLLKVGKE